MSEATWMEVDLDTLTDVQRIAYDDYKRLQRQAAQCRETFERHMADGAALPKGKRLVFGYRFGKLSVAVVNDDRKPAKPKAAAKSLADYLADQARDGR